MQVVHKILHILEVVQQDLPCAALTFQYEDPYRTFLAQKPPLNDSYIFQPSTLGRQCLYKHKQTYEAFASNTK